MQKILTFFDDLARAVATWPGWLNAIVTGLTHAVIATLLAGFWGIWQTGLAQLAGGGTPYAFREAEQLRKNKTRTGRWLSAPWYDHVGDIVFAFAGAGAVWAVGFLWAFGAAVGLLALGIGGGALFGLPLEPEA